MNFDVQLFKIENDIKQHLLDILLADNIFSRARGLLFRRPLEDKQGLLLSPCSAIHTFFMSYHIDIYFIDQSLTVSKICRNIKPWRQAVCFSARYVLETKSGNTAMKDVVEGEKLVWA